MSGGKHPLAVVGASVAGLTTAYYLARAGASVSVFEEQNPFRPAQRTLIVTPAFLKLLDFDLDHLILNRIRTFELISSKSSTRIRLREPDIVLDRAQLLESLREKAQGAGVRVYLGYRFIDLFPDGGNLALRFSDMRGLERVILASRVVGADGVHSSVARSIGQNSLRQVGLAQARVLLPKDMEPDTVRVWFSRMRTRFFYWLIPESRGTGAAGVIAENPGEAHELLHNFIKDQDLNLLEWQRGGWVPLFPLNPALTPIGNRRIILVGDAAAHVKNTTVGGVVAGIRGGLAAARSILRNNPCGSELRALKRELFAHSLVRWVLDHFTDEDYDKLLNLLNKRAIQLLGRYHRDELAQALWLVLLSQPMWLMLSLRAVLRRVGCQAQSSRR